MSEIWVGFILLVLISVFCAGFSCGVSAERQAELSRAYRELDEGENS